MVFFPGKQSTHPSRLVRTRSGDPAAYADQRLDELMAAPDISLRDLQNIWTTRPRGGWADRPDIYCQLGEQVLRKGEPLIAYDMLVEGSRHRPRDVRLRQLLGLTLARSGATARGNAVLRELRNEGHSDGETLGILAGTYKDLWADSDDSKIGRKYLEEAHRLYHEAYAGCSGQGDLEAAYYNGINAATTALLLGEAEQAKTLAGDADRLCERVLADPGPNTDAYWAMATRGEAALLRGDFEQAVAHYRTAVSYCPGRYADFGVTCGQARMLLEHLGGDTVILDPCFQLPSVVVFAGCYAECLEPTPELEHIAAEAIRNKLQSLGAGFGYTSLYGLCDLVFIEEMLALGGEVHVVMPLALNAFRRNLGALAGNEAWAHRYRHALDQATQVQGVTELADADSQVFRRYTQRVLDGLGRLHRHALDSSLSLLTLARDGTPLVSESLTRHWPQDENHPGTIEVCDLGPGVEEFTKQSIEKPDGQQHRVMALLFADVVGYSHILEQEIPNFVEHFLGGIAQLEADSPARPVQKNTWGDALYFVFDQIEDAALFALKLSSMVNETDWREKGISTPIDLRIALHAGPVYQCDDPIVGRPSFCGTHVNWAARIEPITPPGQVYASQPFAALVETRDITSVVCDYVGQVPLAKSYGDFPLYHVRRPA